MEKSSRNPLEINTSLIHKKPMKCNKRGRPTSEKAVTFTPQPRSIVSQLLNKAREENSNHVREKNLISELSSCHVKELNFNSNMQPEDVQGSFTLHLTNSGDCNKYDNLNDSYLLLNNQNNYEGCLLDIKKNGSQLPEIVCHVCSHRSSTQKAHRKHLRVHKNQPYKCNFPNCSYSCKLSSNLIKHKRIHTSEKPYLCDQCTFRSNFVNSLKVHKRTHTSERPYGCQHCSYRCNSSSNLKKHCLHRHREKT